jgi:hypothetical protein
MGAPETSQGQELPATSRMAGAYGSFEPWRASSPRRSSSSV